MAKVGAVDGNLIKWAREQQELTLRTVLDRGGPSIGFQSEVERGRKTEVSAKILQTWVKILGVTEAFARGEVVAYNKEPAECRGFAGDVVSVVMADPANWAAMGSMERFRNVLWTIGTRSRKAPRVVLAYVLGLELESLDRLLNGDMIPAQALVKAVAELTTLPEEFFRVGRLERADVRRTYDPVIDLALAEGLTPDDLEHLIRRRRKLQPDGDRLQLTEARLQG